MFHSKSHPSQVPKSGFMIHSVEFWWLAKKFVHHPDVALTDERFAADSIATFHATVQDLKGK